MYKHTYTLTNFITRADVSRQCVREVMRLCNPENFPIKYKTLLLLSNEEHPQLITCPQLQHFEDQAVHSPGFDTLHERSVEGKREEEMDVESEEGKNKQEQGKFKEWGKITNLGVRCSYTSVERGHFALS